MVSAFEVDWQSALANRSLAANAAQTDEAVMIDVQITGLNLHWPTAAGAQDICAHNRIVRLSLVQITEAEVPLICWAKNGSFQLVCS